MGLFDKLKRDIKHTAKQALLPKDIFTYRNVQFHLVSDESSLPDDKKVLLQMAKYYNDGSVCIDTVNREEKRDMILKKVFPLIQQDEGYDVEVVKDMYFECLLSPDERNEHFFHRFIENIKACDLSLDELYQREASGKSVIEGQLFISRFYNSSIEETYVDQNIMVLLDVIWELVEKEKNHTQGLYFGYYMFMDLYNHYQNGGPHTTFKKRLWNESNKYLNLVFNIYNLAPTYVKIGDKKKAQRYLDQKPKLIEMNEHAKNHLHLLNRDEFVTRFNHIQSGVAERDAKYEKGKLLLTNYLTTDEKQEGIRLMKEAASEGHPTSRNEMIEILAKENDPTALTALAYDYLEGKNNVKIDITKAIDLFKQAARGGSAEAIYYLSTAYKNGKYVLEDKQRADSLLKEAAKLKHAQAMSDVADLEKQNNNKEEALAIYKQIVQLEESEENARAIKHAIAQIVDVHIPRKGSHFDVDENTLGLCSLVFDYVRLDAPIVTNYDLNEMLEKALNLDVSAIDHLSLYYELESRGPMVMGTIPGSKIFNEDIDRALDMRIIHQSFELINIALHIMKLSNGETSSIYSLAIAYFNGKNNDKARTYIDLGIELNIPSVLAYVHKVWDKLGYDRWYARECLEKAAKLGNKAAILELEYQQMITESDRERKEYVERILKDQEESKKALKRIGFDLVEREIDMMLGGTGYNIDEKALLGQLSFAEASNLRHLRKKILEDE